MTQYLEIITAIILTSMAIVALMAIILFAIGLYYEIKKMHKDNK